MAFTWHRVSVGLQRAGGKGWPGEVQWGGGRVGLAGWSPPRTKQSRTQGSCQGHGTCFGALPAGSELSFPYSSACLRSPCLSPLLSIFPGMHLSQSHCWDP